MINDPNSFNYTHPELEEGEMFLTNVSSNTYCWNGLYYFDSEPSKRRAISEMSELGYVTKRLGKVAYDVDGNILETAYPVFIQKSEYVQGLKQYD